MRVPGKGSNLMVSMRLFDRITKWWGSSPSARILSKLETLEEKMSLLSEWATRQETNLNEVKGTLDAIGAAVTKLDELIQKLQNSSGVITPEDQALLDKIEAASKDLAKRALDIKTDAEVPPGEEPVQPFARGPGRPPGKHA